MASGLNRFLDLRSAGSGLLLSNYLGAIYLALMPGSTFNTPVMAGAHGLLAAILVWRTWKLDAEG